MAEYEFRFVPAEDESVDAEYQVLRWGVATRFTIQCCEDGALALVEHGFENGELAWIKHLYIFDNLDRAKATAIATLTKKEPAP